MAGIGFGLPNLEGMIAGIDWWFWLGIIISFVFIISVVAFFWSNRSESIMRLFRNYPYKARIYGLRGNRGFLRRTDKFRYDRDKEGQIFSRFRSGKKAQAFDPNAFDADGTIHLFEVGDDELYEVPLTAELLPNGAVKSEWLPKNDSGSRNAFARRIENNYRLFYKLDPLTRFSSIAGVLVVAGFFTVIFYLAVSNVTGSMAGVAAANNQVASAMMAMADKMMAVAPVANGGVL